jgi:hypothetical protein
LVSAMEERLQMVEHHMIVHDRRIVGEAHGEAHGEAALHWFQNGHPMKTVTARHDAMLARRE